MTPIQKRNYLKSKGIEFWLNDFKDGLSTFNLFRDNILVRKGEKRYKDAQMGLIECESVWYDYVIKQENKKNLKK